MIRKLLAIDISACSTPAPALTTFSAADPRIGSYSKSGNVLGNRIPLTNLKLLVVGGLIRSIIECYGPLLCKVSGPRRGLVKHEDLGASPQMAKRLEGILRSKG